MELFWLITGSLIVIVVTYLCLTEGSERWMAYYGLSLFAFGSYFLRRYMRKRMEKHIAYLEEQKKNSGGLTETQA
jgi:hypothetical protein